MKSQILKIAGVKSEKEFYKKYPSEEAFMKKHGKAFKKAQIGTLIGGEAPHQSVSKPASFINFQDIYDESDKLISGSTQAERDKAAYDQAVLAASSANADNSGEQGGVGGMMGGIGDIFKMFGGQGNGEETDVSGSMPDMAISRDGSDIHKAYSGTNVNNWWSGLTSDTTTMAPGFNINQYGIGPQTMGKMQGTTSAKTTNPGVPVDTSDPNWMNKQDNPYVSASNPAGKSALNIANSSIGDDRHQGETPTESGFTKATKALGPLAGPLTGIAQGIDALNAEEHAKQNAQRDAKVAEVARVASATREEQSKRRYVRPEDIQNTGEEFFPIYGVGTNILTRNGGAIHRAQDGSYIGGNPTEIQNTYSNGYDIYTDGGYEPLINYNQQKDFRQGGFLHRAQTGNSPNGIQRWQNSMNGVGSSGTPYGAIGHTATGVAQGAMGGQNAGGQIGGTAGKAIGSIFGPVGGMVGEFVGGVAGNLLDTNPRDMKKAQDITKAHTSAMALNSAFQGLEESHNRFVRNGGDIASYEDGGYMNPNYNPQLITMFGDHSAADFADYAHKYRAGGHLREYTPPSERAMETFQNGGKLNSYAMGGQLKTHWGGKAETLSHNPYMPGSGETVLFRGQSHNESDREGNTGIGITYGENPVEVERGEPMFEMQAGGEIDPMTGEAENTGVVFGNMQVDKKVAAQLNDPDLMKVADIYHGKKFKNIGVELSKQEAKQNKIISKNSDLIDSLKVETSLDKARLAGLQAMLQGADTKLRDIANTKITLANYQNAINDAKEELSDVVGENLSAEDLARGYAKLDKDPVTKDSNRWGGNIVKRAQDGTTTTPKTKTFKSEREANAAGYFKGEDGKYHRTVKKFSTEDKETKSADALDHVPTGQKKNASGLWGKVTPEMFAEAKAANAWYPGWSTFNPKSKADVLAYQKAFNARAKANGSTAHIQEDGDFGDQTVTARIAEAKKTTPVNSEQELTAIVDEPTTTKQTTEKPKFPWLPYINQAIRYLTPTDQTGMDYEQLYPEFYAMASNQVEPVPAQSYQPELIVPYDISLQAQRNAVISGQRALQRQLGYNPAAQANAAPAAYNAINEINEKEFIANQGLKNQVYTGNVNTMNDAKKINLGIFADQWAKQSQARSNTKATTQAALNSIADKYAKHKLENRKLAIYENMYNYRFGKSGRAQNWNGLQIFDTTLGENGSSDKTGGLASGKEFTYDAAGNIVGVRSSDKDTTSADLEGAGGISLKNGGSTKNKKDYKNSSVVRAFKNL